MAWVSGAVEEPGEAEICDEGEPLSEKALASLCEAGDPMPPSPTLGMAGDAPPLVWESAIALKVGPPRLVNVGSPLASAPAALLREQREAEGDRGRGRQIDRERGERVRQKREADKERTARERCRGW